MSVNAQDGSTDTGADAGSIAAKAWELKTDTTPGTLPGAFAVSFREATSPGYLPPKNGTPHPPEILTVRPPKVTGPQ